MSNRIRHFRKLRGLKLRELADRIGTTPQSVSRLETGHMTLSLDWLNRIADALDVHPTDLIDAPEARAGTPLLGHVGATGRVEDGPLGDIDIVFPVAHAVAVRLLHPIGSYRAGEVLVADRRGEGGIARAAGRDALAELADGSRLLVRVVPGAGSQGGYVLVSLDLSRVHAVEEVRWVAPVVMSVRYL